MVHLSDISRLYNSIHPRILSVVKLHPFMTISVAAAILAGFVWYLSAGGTTATSGIVARPTKGLFQVTVTTTGELQAKNSISIMGPENARAANIWQMRIANIVPEGTVVKKGEFVGELDKSEITGKFKDSQLSVQKLEAQFLQTKLDSTLALSQARDEMVNLFYAEEEKRLVVEQSTYEAPAMRRQAEIEYERAQRNSEQAKKNYVTKTRQAVAKAQAAEADLLKERQRQEIYGKAMEEFTIKAPADGMVVYAREWNGKKRVVGSTVSAWDPTIATLPDLRDMESITYVNEVDIQKIAAGQKVKLKLDADPNKILTGSVTTVANIGEQRPNSDSKVFEVRIKVNESDTTLRPAMTTANEILVAEIDTAISILLESVHTEGTMTFVYKKNGGSIVKQEVKLGMLNDNAAVVQRGIDEEDEILLTVPPESDKLRTILLETAN